MPWMIKSKLGVSQTILGLMLPIFSLAFHVTPWNACYGQEDAGRAELKVPKPLTKYMGRRIALPMSYHGIPWLNRPERIQEENPQEMLEQLDVKPGMTVCDMGCGDGYYTIELAKRVGPSGKVIAVDIQPEMLQELSRRCQRNDLKNVEMILGEPHNPKLPVGKIDLILMVDVYHEFSNPEEMLDAMRSSLTPDGRIALVEFRGEDPQVPIKPEHKMTKKQILKEYEANAMRLVGQYDRLPWQHLMFLGSDLKQGNAKQEESK
jgi:ubiquinone/menaquinone biosynthesis C-methylase UbiE